MNELHLENDPEFMEQLKIFYTHDEVIELIKIWLNTHSKAQVILTDYFEEMSKVCGFTECLEMLDFLIFKIPDKELLKLIEIIEKARGELVS